MRGAASDAVHLPAEAVLGPDPGRIHDMNGSVGQRDNPPTARSIRVGSNIRSSSGMVTWSVQIVAAGGPRLGPVPPGHEERGRAGQRRYGVWHDQHRVLDRKAVRNPQPEPDLQYRQVAERHVGRGSADDDAPDLEEWGHGP
jgi:hypothetical protein